MGTRIVLQDYFIVIAVRRRFHTVFPYTSWNSIQLVLWKHMYSSVVENHMILVTVFNWYLSTHGDGMENMLRS